MNSILKNQILKPLSKFTKNLSPDRIHLSAIKGEGELNNLEFDEAALMELMDLPTWLNIKKAVCNHVSVKIQWTKLKSQPINVHLDDVLVEIEALEEPRPLNPTSVPSYRVDQGQYGFIDRVIDGIRVSISNVRIVFAAAAFKASLELSRVLVASKMPNWKEAELRSTAVRDPSRNAILLFKEISWDTTRIEANGLQDLQVTPVKLITNQSRIRITLKKSLSDCAIISSRVQFLLDDLLWVLTISQMEAAILFMKSLKKSIMKSSEQSKARAEEKMKRQHPNNSTVPNKQQSSSRGGSEDVASSRTAGIPLLSTSSSSQDSRRASYASSTPAPSPNNNNSSQTMRSLQLSRLFDYYDVCETSYHYYTGRIELHLCEEGQPDVKLSSNAVCNGALRCTLLKINLDFYPFHAHGAEKRHWPGYSDLCKFRNRWVDSLLNEFRQSHSFHGQSEDQLDSMISKTLTRSNTSDSSDKLSSHQHAHCLMESVTVLRLEDFSVSTVSTTKKQRGIAATRPTVFFGSDKARLKLPEETTSIFVDYTEYYYPEALSKTTSSDNFSGTSSIFPVPEPKLFIQLNPVQVQVDYETIVWLNAFYLNLTKNLHAWSELVPVEQMPLVMESIMMHVRLEALMPRLVFTAEYDVSGQPERPSGLQAIASTLSIHNVLQDDSDMHWDPLHSLVNSYIGLNDNYDFSEESFHWSQQFHKSNGQRQTSAQFPRQSKDAPFNWSCFKKPNRHKKFKRSSHPALEILWKIQSDQVWLEFTGARTSIGNRNASSQHNRPQTFLEPIPLNVWIHMAYSDEEASPSTPKNQYSNFTIKDHENIVAAVNRYSMESQSNVSPSVETHDRSTPSMAFHILCDVRTENSVKSNNKNMNESTLLQLRLSHYQLLFINRLVDSLTRVMEALIADQTEILVTRSSTPLPMEENDLSRSYQETSALSNSSRGNHLELALVSRIPGLHFTMLMPALAEGLPLHENSSLMLNKQSSIWSLSGVDTSGVDGGFGAGDATRVSIYARKDQNAMRNSCSDSSFRRISDVVIDTGQESIKMQQHLLPATHDPLEILSREMDERPRSSLGFLSELQSNGPLNSANNSSTDRQMKTELSDVTSSVINPNFHAAFDSSGSSVSNVTRQAQSVSSSPTVNVASRMITAQKQDIKRGLNDSTRPIAAGGVAASSRGGGSGSLSSSSIFRVSGSAFSRLGEKLKNTAAQAVGSVVLASTVDDQQDFESDHGSVAGSDFSDGTDDMLSILIPNCDNEPISMNDCTTGAPEYSIMGVQYGGPNARDIQVGRPINADMIPVDEAFDVANSIGPSGGMDEAMSVMSSCTSRFGMGGDVVSTVTFCLTQIELALSVTDDGFAVALLGGGAHVLESGANKGGIRSGSNERLDADGCTVVTCPIHDVSPSNTAMTHLNYTTTASCGGGKDVPLVALRISPPPPCRLSAAGDENSSKTKVQSSKVPHIQMHLLHTLQLELLMSSVINLGDFFEDELVQEASQYPTLDIYMKAALDLRLKEDRPCTNLTCPGQHPIVALTIPPGLQVSRDPELVLCIRSEMLATVSTQDMSSQTVIPSSFPSPSSTPTSKVPHFFSSNISASLPNQISQWTQTLKPPLLLCQSTQTLPPPPSTKPPPARPPPITNSLSLASRSVTQQTNTDLLMSEVGLALEGEERRRQMMFLLVNTSMNTEPLPIPSLPSRPDDIQLSSTGSASLESEMEEQVFLYNKKICNGSASDVALQTSPMSPSHGSLAAHQSVSGMNPLILTSSQLANTASALGHNPSQELLNHYYQENVRLREKVASLRKEKMACFTDLSQCQRELEETRRERDCFLATLEKLQNELAQRSNAMNNASSSQLSSSFSSQLGARISTSSIANSIYGSSPSRSGRTLGPVMSGSVSGTGRTDSGMSGSPYHQVLAVSEERPYPT